MSDSLRRLLHFCLALASVGCLDFKADADFCRQQGRCQRPPVACPAGQFCWENPYPHGYDIEGVFSPGPGELWAVGEQGSILHLRDGGWSYSTVGDPAGLFRSARGVAADRAGSLLVLGKCLFGGYIVGCIFGRGDAGWAPAPLWAAGAEAVAVTSAGVFVAGGGSIDVGGSFYLAHLESTDPWLWSPLAGADGRAPLTQTAVSGPDRFWAGGRDRLVQIVGTAVELDETPPLAIDASWTLVAAPDGRAMLVGAGSCTTRAPSGEWSAEEVLDGGGVVAGAPLNGRSHFVTTARATRTGWSELLSCEPGSCSACTATRLTQDRLSSIAANGTEAWIGGANGRLFHVAGDGQATDLSPGSRAALTDLAVADAGTAWATGEGGTLLRRGARGWEKVPTGRTERLVGVAQLESGDVFVAGSTSVSPPGVFVGVLGDGGLTPMRLESLDGRDLAPPLKLSGLVSLDAEHTWAFGAYGRVLRYLPRERAWRQVVEEAEAPSMIERNWVSAWVDPGGVLWLGDGQSGTAPVLRRVDGASVEDVPIADCGSVTVAGLGPGQPVGACGATADPAHAVFRRRADGGIEWLPAIPVGVPKAVAGGYALAIAAAPPEDIWIMASGTTAVARYRRPPGAETPRWEMVDVGLGGAFKLSQVRVAGRAVWLVGDRGVLLRRPLDD